MAVMLGCVMGGVFTAGILALMALGLYRYWLDRQLQGVTG